MDDQSNASTDQIMLSLDQGNFDIYPGTQRTIQLFIINRQTVEDLLKITVEGIPIEWVAMEQPVLSIGAGEQRSLGITVSVPDSPDLHAGHFPFKIQAVSQNHPEVNAFVAGEMTVAAYQSAGRIGLLLGHLSFVAIPGSQIVIPILLQNRGLAADVFRLEVGGLPPDWMSTTNPITHLNPGEQKEITLDIFPPRTAEGGVGRHPFTIAIYSQLAPNQPETVKCTLDLTAYNAFGSWLEPKDIAWGSPAFITVKNDGNIPDIYSIELLSQEGTLAFERIIQETTPGTLGGPIQTHISTTEATSPEILRVQPGQTGRLEFRARPSKPPIFGGAFSLPILARVTSTNSKTTATLNGQLLGRALLPLWVPVSLVMLLVLILCVTLFSYVASRNNAAKAQETDQAATALALGLLNTPTPTFTSTISTATVGVPVTGPTDTPVPPTATDTPLPPTPTFTQTVPAPTATATTQPPTATAGQPPATATIPPSPALAGTIVFQSNRDGNLQIYAMDLSNRSITRLTKDTASDTQPALAPDGVQVAYMSNQTGNNEIFLSGTDRRTPINLTNNPADDQQPAWSPDGQFIAFTSNRDGNPEIYIMRSDGTQVRRLTNNPANDFGPSWFQTGGLLDRQDWIAFTSNRNGNQEIYIVHPDGTGLQNLTNNSANDYSPFGSSNLIAFVSERDGNQEIYTMNVDGTLQMNITKNPGRDYDPVLSPNGAWIAFTSERDGNPEVYVIRTDGTAAANLTGNPAQDSHPSWR